MDAIPTGICLTTYAGDVSAFRGMPLQDLADRVAARTPPVTVGKVFAMDEIVEANRTMEENRAGGKIAALTRVSTL